MNAIHHPASLSRNIPNLTCASAFKTHSGGALRILLLLLFSLAAAPLLWAQTANPSVTTDRADYPPGDTAVITGNGFQPDETVTLQVVHAEGTPSTGQDHEPWTVTAEADGTFLTTWHVCEDDCVGETLLLTAVGATSGVSAEALFTDAGPPTFAYGWGFNGSGQVGDGTTTQRTTPVGVVGVLGGQTAVKVAAGANHSLAIANNGTAWAWGDNSLGKLGHSLPFPANLTPVQVQGLPAGKQVISIAGSSSHSLAAIEDGTVWAWGDNSSGQLGTGVFGGSSTAPIKVQGLLSGKTVLAVACGTSHGLALVADGSIYAWGNNQSGQLGNGGTGESASPVQVIGLPSGKKAVAIAGGGNHSLAALDDGKVWAWGRNNFGQLGNNTLTDNLTPISVQGLPIGTMAIAVAAGFEHSLALGDNGTVWAWGRGDSGQLGNGGFLFSKVAVQVNALAAGRTAIAIGGSNVGNHSLAAANDGTVWTWGSDSNGQLGNDVALVNSATPVQAQGLLVGHKAVSVAGGVRHSLAAVQDNSSPVANCKNVTVSAGASCTANASIDDGSSDPDSGDTISLTQTPAGPYPLGPTTVTLTVTDNHGVSSTCSAVVNVVDTTPPSVSCPVGTSASADANCQAAIPNVLSGVSASDNCSAAANIMLSQSPAAGTPVGLGPHTITVMATDQAGNSASCTTTFTVDDTTPPSVTCPVGTSASADANCQAAIPNVLSGVSASDNCSAAANIMLSQSPAAGTPVGLGPHTITVTAMDQAGNSASCTTTFTVNDITPPSVSCPAGTSASADGNCQAAIPNVLSGVSASDNCRAAASITLSQSPAAGTPVGLGPHTITVTAMDQAGNSASCTTTFTVNDITPPSVSCPAGTSASADANCQAAIPNVFSGVNVSDNCSALASITLSQSPAAGTLVGTGPHTITVTATDQAGNSATCTTTFTVNDTTPPSVSCPAGTSASAGANCQAAIPNVLSGVSASDNCSGAGSITLSQSPAAGTPVGLGPHTITVTATDQAGNSATCATTLTVNDTTPPSVSCPAGTSASADANCQAAIPNVLSGVNVSDNCSALASITLSQSPAAGTLVGTGPHTITVTATDQAGNSATCTTTFTVNDTAPPSVSCPAGASASADVNCQAAIPNVLSGAIASDNCSAAASITLSQSPAVGTSVGLGPHTITVTAMDQAGNRATCTTTFTVNDTTPPSVTCPAGTSASADANCQAAIPNVLNGVTVSDNCSALANIALSQSPAAGTLVGTGPHTITVTATDQAGNSSSCTTTFTVNDTTPPSVACPGDVASCSANVNVGTATATDNCPGVTVAGVRSDSQPLTAPYPDGVTTITWTATDASGNSASCQQSVTIGNSSLAATITSPASGALYVIGTTVNFSGTFTDTSGGTHTATWMFDNIVQAGAINESMRSVSASYTFTTAGVYLVSLTVNGSCGSSTATTVDGLTAMVVIYDPNGGFVTGGGWINSPASAFPAQPTLTGKANFGFVSKYLKGATIPTGETEFQFKVANLNFHSTSYEWLVVAGAKAQYKGVGTINNAGNYGFLLTAIDGQLNGGGGTDKFRIKIWDNNNNGVIVYDNKIGAADGADPTTVLGGGSIVIHK